MISFYLGFNFLSKYDMSFMRTIQTHIRYTTNWNTIINSALNILLLRLVAGCKTEFCASVSIIGHLVLIHLEGGDRDAYWRAVDRKAAIDRKAADLLNIDWHTIDHLCRD